MNAPASLMPIYDAMLAAIDECESWLAARCAEPIPSDPGALLAELALMAVFTERTKQHDKHAPENLVAAIRMRATHGYEATLRDLAGIPPRRTKRRRAA